ncbi:hypothetical protein DYB26_013158, partial [Aphanomyces astaci]
GSADNRGPARVAEADRESPLKLPPYRDDTYVLPDRVLRKEQARDPFTISMKAYVEDKALPLEEWLMKVVTRTSEHYEVKDQVLYRRFADGVVAYKNTPTPIVKVLDKRRTAPREPEYLVRHADGETHWTPRSRLTDYESFISEYENLVRSHQDLPTLRRSPRLAELDVEAVVREY